MTIEELKLAKEKLLETKKENNKKISLYKERYNMTTVNQKEYQLINTLFFSVIPFFGIVITLMFNNSLTTFLINNISPIFISILITSVSLTVGTVITKLINKKYKIKKRFKSFSKAKTEREKLEEKINYETKIEKINNRNIIIDNILSNIENKINLIKNTSISEEKQDKYTEEELNHIVDELSKIIDEKYTKLDILTTKKVLRDNFYKIREKGHNIMDIPLITIGGVLIATIITTLPFIVTKNIIPISPLHRDIMLFGSMLTGGLIADTYYIIRNSKYKKVFNKLNKILGVNSLPNKEKIILSNEQEKLETLIDDLITEIIVTKTTLIEHKESFEKKISENKKQNIEDTREKKLTMPKYISSDIKEDTKILVRKKVLPKNN